MDPDAETNTFILKIIILTILLILSAIFSSAETAFMSVNKIRLKQLINKGNKKAIKVNKILEDKDKMLSAILIGNNFVNLSASSITTTLVYELYGDGFASIATGILTFIILIFGEIIPKTAASKHSEKFSMFYSFIIYLLMLIFTPIIFIVNKISELFMKIFKLDTQEPEITLTEETIKTIVDVGQEEGIIKESEHELIQNVFEFADSCARDIMIPKTSIKGVMINDSYEDIMKIFKEEKYTRLVIYDESKQNIDGIINIRDMIHVSKEEFDINKIMKNPLITYEYKKISELLKDMKKTSNNMAIVIDEYGEIIGLLTLEDILEELVGEIRDEYDEDELTQIIKISDNVYEIEGILKIDDVNRELKLNIESKDYDTIGGFIIEQLDKLPNLNDKVVWNNLRFDILNISNNRIEKIKLTID